MALWEIGETVFLNSGSPPMKVVGQDDVGKVRVVWSAGAKIHQAHFHPACLTRVEPEWDEQGEPR
jgi:uncharacterized protein YodC (DUF2158 family)